KKELKDALQPLLAEGDRSAGEGKIEAAWKQMEERIQALLTDLPRWTDTLGGEARDKATLLATTADQWKRDPIRYHERAVQRSDEGSRISQDMIPILNDLRELFDTLATRNPDLKVTNASPAQLDQDLKTLGSAVAELKKALAGNIESFVADQVSLYYFSDVPR